MQLKYFFLMSALISSTAQAQHIANSSTKILFNNEKKSFFEWVRDDRHKEFGKTMIMTVNINKSELVQKGTVKTLKENDLNNIVLGLSFYCSNIKKENNIAYGAIIIDPNQHHFDAEIARKICLDIKNSYLREQLNSKSHEGT